ncbi:MAG: hypothetical protein V3U34_00410 [candidate division NC10 bacterium]
MSAGTVFTSSIANALKETLETIVDDDTDGYEEKALLHQWLDELKMEDNYEDDLESGGPGLASEKPEGTEIPLGSIREGYITRYIARTFALKLIITEEALEDRKYPKILNAARRLKRAMWKTADIDATNILVRMFNTAFVGGDSQPLGSASHTLPHSGTFSNVMAVPMSPSRASVIIATSQIAKYPGHDGVTEGYEPRIAVCPTEQWAVWEGLLGSRFAPEPGEFNEINVVNQTLDIRAVPNKYWNNTTTNWALLTNNDNALNFRWRRRPRNRTWVDNDQELMKYAISARWARGWSDPRAIYCVEA